MKQENFSSVAVIRAIRDNLLSRLEHNEDFRVWRGLEFLLAKEAQRAKGRSKAEAHTVSSSPDPQPNSAADSQTKDMGAPSPNLGSRAADLQNGMAVLKTPISQGQDNITFPAKVTA